MKGSWWSPRRVSERWLRCKLRDEFNRFPKIPSNELFTPTAIPRTARSPLNPLSRRRPPQWTERTRLHAVGGGLIQRVERESWLSGKGKVLDGVRRELLERFLRGPAGRLGCETVQRVSSEMRCTLLNILGSISSVLRRLHRSSPAAQQLSRPLHPQHVPQRSDLDVHWAILVKQSPTKRMR